MALLEFFVNYLTEVSYFAIVILILIGSIGIPFPEEIVMLAAGWVASLGYMNIFGAIVVSLISVILGDLIGYGIGHHGGKLFKRLLSEEKFKKVESYFERHGSKTIFFSRFLSGIRVFFPIAAGATKMPLKEFLIWDTIAALVWVPLMVLMGFWFGRFIPKMITWIRQFDIIFGVLFAIFLIVMLFVYKERKIIVSKFEHLRHEFFKRMRKNESPLEVLLFGDVMKIGQRVYAKQRKDGKIKLFVEFIKDGVETKCLHGKTWLRKESYVHLVKRWTAKLGKPIREDWPTRTRAAHQK